MWRYIAKRLLWLILVLICAAVLIFTIMWFVPGDPAEMMLSGVGTQEDIARLREQLGLNDPFIVQLGNFLYNAFVKFDFGSSYVYKTPVLDELALRLPRTLKLGIISIAISSLLVFLWVSTLPCTAMASRIRACWSSPWSLFPCLSSGWLWK